MSAHLTDYATPITAEEVKALAEIVNPFPHLVFGVIGKRGVIKHFPSGEALQFVTRRDLRWVGWLAEGWNQHFVALKAKAGMR